MTRRGKRSSNLYGALVTLAMIISVSCAYWPHEEKKRRTESHNQVMTSLVSVLSLPSRYDGQQINVVGVAVISGHETILYLSERDAEFGVIANGISLDLSDENLENLKTALPLLGEYLLVRGTFVSRHPGARKHTVGYMTEIFDLGRLNEWARDLNDK